MYTQGMAPLVAAKKRSKVASGGEMLPVVEPTGEVIARASRETCHQDRLLHPVVRMHIVNRRGEIYLQKRSASKTVFPSRWDTAAAGHVEYGELFEQAVHREAAEELGFYDFNPQYLDNYIYTVPEEKELVNIYGAVGNFILNPHNEEVEMGAYWTVEEIEENIGKDVFTPSFEYDWAHYKKQLLALL